MEIRKVTECSKEEAERELRHRFLLMIPPYGPYFWHLKGGFPMREKRQDPPLMPNQYVKC
jgi:hypothetical protein